MSTNLERRIFTIRLAGLGYWSLMVVFAAVAMDTGAFGFTAGWLVLSLGAIPVALHLSLTASRCRVMDLSDLAYRDDLTGLANRRYFTKRANEILGSTARGVGIVLLDVDGLKLVNDRCGHQAGDELIISAARQIKQAVGNKGEACRFGGDEFAILVPGQGDANFALFDVLEALKPFRARFRSCGHSHVIEISRGVAIGELQHEILDNLLRRADMDLWESKRQARTSRAAREMAASAASRGDDLTGHLLAS